MKKIILILIFLSFTTLSHTAQWFYQITAVNLSTDGNVLVVSYDLYNDKAGSPIKSDSVEVNPTDDVVAETPVLIQKKSSGFIQSEEISQKYGSVLIDGQKKPL